MKINFLIVCIFYTFFVDSFSQNIDSITYTPLSPTYEDTITIFCYVTYPEYACQLVRKEFYFAPSYSIIAKAFHCGGPLTVLCPVVDTFKIKIPDGYPGNYTFYYMPGFITDSSQCTFPIFGNGDTIPYPWSIASIIIPVTEPVGIIEKNSNSTQSFIIHPNPFSTTLAIEFNCTDAMLVASPSISFSLYNSTGKEISCIQKKHLPKGTHHEQINTEQFTPGIYLLKADINGKTQTMKIIKL